MSTTRPRSTVHIDYEVLRLLKVVAAERETTVKALTEKALMEWAKRTPEARRAKRRAS